MLKAFNLVILPTFLYILIYTGILKRVNSMVRVSYYGYGNISSSLIHVNTLILKGYAVKGLHFDCKSKDAGFDSYISLYSY